jgi:hypothetical protein
MHKHPRNSDVKVPQPGGRKPSAVPPDRPDRVPDKEISEPAVDPVRQVEQATLPAHLN